MSETENVEQKASGAVVATAWVCEECGDCREQVSAPTGCLTCERWAERRGKQPPDPDWSPLYSAAIVRHLIALAYERCGSLREYARQRAADLLAEVTK